MKSLLTTVGIIGLFSLAIGQEATKDDEGFDVFTAQEGDTTYVMKKYMLGILKEGPDRGQPENELQEIQAAHLAHLGALAERKKICIAGPLEGHQEYRGLVIFNVPTAAEAQELANQDPAVKAGRLVVEIIPWWVAKGSSFF